VSADSALTLFYSSRLYFFTLLFLHVPISSRFEISAQSHLERPPSFTVHRGDFSFGTSHRNQLEDRSPALNDSKGSLGFNEEQLECSLLRDPSLKVKFFQYEGVFRLSNIFNVLSLFLT
jgi:hypothetical protein